MRKTLSILLAAMLSLSVAATAFAVDPKNNIVLGADADSGLVLKDSLLKPGETYRFPVSISIAGAEATPLNDDLLEDYSFKISNTGEGDSMSEFVLDRIGGVYYISATVKAGWPAVSTEEEYSMKLTEKSASKNAVEITVAFETGYKVVSDDYIASLAKEDEIKVDNDTPVFTKSQLNQISDLNNNKKVTFTNDNWNYTVIVSGMKDINMLHNNNAIAEILNKYADNNFAFLTFPAGTKFTTNGTMEIDVADYTDDFGGKFFVYRYLGGKLTLINSSYDADDEVLSFTTNTLGRFVITDKAITDAVVVPETDSNLPSNPSTGATI
ncbi:hypothetical protein ACS3UN_03890 [Oscillospiraceae bacterium LTW-04]|nr:hypothetical protein RBH76_06575 [Oscillospiraceae bacterium MB24-C1]